MANTILTPQMVTREALRILHQKANFIGSIDRQYDDQFAKKEAKIGNTLNVRVPNQYTVRTGPNLQPQDTQEVSIPIVISNQKGVDVKFSSSELSLGLQDFADRVLEPAMAVLASNIEADALSMYKSVYNQVNNLGSPMSMRTLLMAGKALDDSLSPRDNNRKTLLSTQDSVDVVDQLKGLFQDSSSVAKQYREGLMGRTAGFDFYQNTLLPRHISGSDAGGYQVSGANQASANNLSGTLAVKTGTGTLKAGDIITIAGVNRVHPESKADTGALQQFVVTADYAGGAGTISIAPGIVTSGATQTVTNAPADSALITKAGGANQVYGLSFAHHKEAFTFATCDLQMPQGVDFAAREVHDGISMRIVRAYDINTDQFPCRIDVMYGYKCLRPQFACRIACN